jgi:hypothetical protein
MKRAANLMRATVLVWLLAMGAFLLLAAPYSSGQELNGKAIEGIRAGELIALINMLFTLAGIIGVAAVSHYRLGQAEKILQELRQDLAKHTASDVELARFKGTIDQGIKDMQRRLQYLEDRENGIQ